MTEDINDQRESGVKEQDSAAGIEGTESACDKCAEIENQLKRALADYANLKRETERREAEWAKYASGSLIEKLVPVMESWRQAEAARPTVADDGSVDGQACLKWMDGVGHARQQLAEVLRRAGVTIIDETGVPFDPMIHEAMLTESREGVEPDTVLEILEPGVKLHDRVLKPAKVKVAV
jgi:molecular chaperone GrpE